MYYSYSTRASARAVHAVRTTKHCPVEPVPLPDKSDSTSSDSSDSSEAEPTGEVVQPAASASSLAPPADTSHAHAAVSNTPAVTEATLVPPNDEVIIARPR